MADNPKDLQQELSQCFGKGVELKAKALEISSELSSLKEAVKETEERLYKVTADMQSVESRSAVRKRQIVI